MNEQAEKANADWIAVQRKGTGTSAELQAEVNLLYQRLERIARSRQPVSAKIKEIKKAVKARSGKIYAQMSRDMIRLAKIVSNNASKQAQRAGAKRRPVKITDAKVRKWVERSPLPASNKTIKDMFDDSIRLAERSAVSAVRLADDDAIEDSVQAIRASNAQSLRYMDVVAITATNKVSNAAKDSTFKQYRAEVDRVIWLSTLDHRTSPFCQSADGKIFPIDEGPRPPAHPRCRSTILLVPKGVSNSDAIKDFGSRPAVVPKSAAAIKDKGIYTKNGRKRSPSRGDHSPLKGTQVKGQSYESWLKKQPKIYQEKILGKSSARRLRNGESLIKVLSDTRSSINFKALEKALN